VIGPTGAVRVLVATKPVDCRKGAEGLAALSMCSGRNGADRVKLIYWDGTGVCLFAKRLEDGRFRWPSVQDGVMRLSLPNFRPCWKDWIGSTFTQRERYRRRCRWCDFDTVNRLGRSAREVARWMF
jgi:transposase